MLPGSWQYQATTLKELPVRASLFVGRLRREISQIFQIFQISIYNLNALSGVARLIWSYLAELAASAIESQYLWYCWKNQSFVILEPFMFEHGLHGFNGLIIRIFMQAWKRIRRIDRSSFNSLLCQKAWLLFYYLGEKGGGVWRFLVFLFSVFMKLGTPAPPCGGVPLYGEESDIAHGTNTDIFLFFLFQVTYIL